MSKEQIEEMRNDIPINLEIDSKDIDAICEILTEQGYRKERQGEWISVEERLPKKSHERYLVYTELGIVDFDIYSAIGGWQGYNYVTHWMPLPEAPNMKGAK